MTVSAIVLCGGGSTRMGRTSGRARSARAGMVTGLKAIANDWAFVTACDMPLMLQLRYAGAVCSGDQEVNSQQ